MNFNEYQKLAKTTAIYDKKHQILYPALGLAGEAGEVANKDTVKLKDRMNRGVIGGNGDKR